MLVSMLLCCWISICCCSMLILCCLLQFYIFICYLSYNVSLYKISQVGCCSVNANNWFEKLGNKSQFLHINNSNLNLVDVDCAVDSQTLSVSALWNQNIETRHIILLLDYSSFADYRRPIKILHNCATKVSKQLVSKSKN